MADKGLAKLDVKTQQSCRLSVMNKNKRTVRFLATSYRLDPEESLIGLWYVSSSRFDYLRNTAAVVKGRDYQFVKTHFSDKARRIRLGKNSEPVTRPVKIAVREHDFSQIGRSTERFSYLTLEEVMQIYNELVEDFSSNEDPIEPAGLKDEAVLESALFHAQTSYEGNYKYPTVESAAAALMYAITHNHPFFNGNKRTSMVAMLVFLERHNLSFKYEVSEDMLFKVSIDLAKHRLVPAEQLYPDAEIEALAHWLHSNSRYVQKGERPITLRKFKQILSHFDCKILPDGRVSRIVKTKNLLGGFGTKVVTTRLARIEPGTEGRQMSRKLIKTIREELQMTSEYGIDSEQFYEMENFTAADFIHTYKRLLGRLGKL